MLPAQELARNHRIGRVDQLAVVEQTRREAVMEVEFMIHEWGEALVLFSIIQFSSGSENNSKIRLSSQKNGRIVRQRNKRA